MEKEQEITYVPTEELQDVTPVESEAEQLTAEQMVENLESDVRAYTKALEDAIKQKADYEEQLEIDKQLWDILDKPGSLERLNPMFGYEKDPMWSELQQKKQWYKNRQERAISEGSVKQFEDQITSIKEALQSSQNKLDKFSEVSQ